MSCELVEANRLKAMLHRALNSCNYSDVLVKFFFSFGGDLGPLLTRFPDIYLTIPCVYLDGQISFDTAGTVSET